MKYKYYDKLINKKTRSRYDVTPIFRHPQAFSNLVKDLIKPFRKTRINKIVSLDALGFVLGGAISNELKVGFVPIRKGGKLPGRNLIRTSFVDYTKKRKTFELNKGAIGRGDRVLIVDEWIETGAQIDAAVRLIERCGGKIIGIATLHVDKNPRTDALCGKYNCKALNRTNR
jgi:adenine phosphoribosyltransferase